MCATDGRARVLRLLVLGVATMTLSACAIVQPRQGTAAPQPAQFSAAFQQFLTNAPAGAKATVTYAPWGGRVSVRAGQEYFAASGRICRELTIQQVGTSRPGLVCELPNGDWATVRPLAPERLPLTRQAVATVSSGAGQ